MQSRIVADHQDVCHRFLEAPQAIEQLVAFGEIKRVLDQAGWFDRKPRQHEFERLARPHGARAQDEINLTDHTRDFFAYPRRRFATTFGQPPVVICDIAFPARFRMTQQV